MVAHHYKKGSVSRRTAISRALGAYIDGSPVATMDYVPDELSRLSDRSIFVHRLEPTLHVYYNSATIQVYTTIFRHIREEFDNSVGPPTLRVVLDFDRASINAAKRVGHNIIVYKCLLLT
ncbi:hypothetical protein ANCDUO_12829 [Ancylostoma duodenale]|uniref:Uncharacterized protein n=1 Tax=Ancylostoma duodenale TaxID=51022 RepID=A0A0C2GIT3_9BILA|nr:hypothetical protein ANCDUO_12829 [Ancylostoma duodenale]